MQEQVTRYHPGLEFYVHPAMGLCGIANDERGSQSTYQYLTADEAVVWLAAWLKGERWMRGKQTKETA